MMKFILMLLVLNPRHELRKDHELLTQVAGYFEAAGAKYEVDPTLLAYWAWKESRFKHNVVAWDRPSIGYSQAHGWAQKWCEDAGHRVQQREGGAMCIGLLFRKGIDLCGDLEAAANWYASGKCKPSKKTRRKMKKRLKEWHSKKDKLLTDILNEDKLTKLDGADEEDCEEAIWGKEGNNVQK